MADAIIERHDAGLPAGRASLVAITGIDGSGKGHVSGLLATELRQRGLNIALINIDPWQHPQSVRLSERNPGLHFYGNAIRWSDLFELLVEPLREHRGIELTSTLIETAVDRYYSHHYSFSGVDLVLLEGIFLLKRELRDRYDQAWWIECSFQTALRRAIARGQEGLAPAETVAAYSRIYFPAQGYHLVVDAPAAAADGIFINE